MNVQYLTIIHLYLGVGCAWMGVIGLFRPQGMIDVIEHWHGPTRFRLAIAGRLVLGLLFVLISPHTRNPDIILILGYIVLVAAPIIALIGQTRLDALIGWWTSRPSLIRVSSVFVVPFGLFLVYTGL